jgi:hypothetical protein
MTLERKNTIKQNKIGHLKIKNYKFERAEIFKYLGVILNPSMPELNPSMQPCLPRFFTGDFYF